MEAKLKTLTWLEEEGLSPTETTDPNASFNLGIKAAGMPLHVVQSTRRNDSIIAAINLVLTEGQLNLLRSKMDESKRLVFFWDLRISLVRNNELGDFGIRPSPPNNIREVFISSKPIYYDELSKSKLMSAIRVVYRAANEVVWLLETHAGANAPKEYRSDFYT